MTPASFTYTTSSSSHSAYSASLRGMPVLIGGASLSNDAPMFPIIRDVKEISDISIIDGSDAIDPRAECSWRRLRKKRDISTDVAISTRVDIVKDN